MEVDMELGLIILTYAFTMTQYFFILWSLKIRVKRRYAVCIGIAILVLFWAALGRTFEPGGEAFYGIRIAFITIPFMIDKEKLLDKIESAVLIALMKDCLLLSIETWFARRTYNIETNFFYVSLYFAGETIAVLVFAIVLRKVISNFDSGRIRKIGSFLDYLIFLGLFDIFTCLWWCYSEIRKGNFNAFEDTLYTSFGAVSLLLLEITILYKKWLAEQVEKHATAEHELYQMEKNYYLSLLDKEADTRKYRHDINNHMICIKALLDEKKYDSLEGYISNLYEDTNSLVNKGYKTGNDILDAMTNYYSDSIDDDVTFSVIGNIHKPLTVDSIGLSSIYSNLLSNAIEEQKRLPEGRERYIRVTLKEGNRYAQIMVANAMTQESILRPEKMKTTKEDIKNHGFGLANIQKNLKECNGSMSIAADNFEFCVKVTIPIKDIDSQ